MYGIIAAMQEEMQEIKKIMNDIKIEKEYDWEHCDTIPNT